MKSPKILEYTYYDKDWQIQKNCKCKFCRRKMTPREYKMLGGVCLICSSMFNKH